jgi:hypothetical protein
MAVVFVRIFSLNLFYLISVELFYFLFTSSRRTSSYSLTAFITQVRALSLRQTKSEHLEFRPFVKECIVSIMKMEKQAVDRSMG